RSAAATTPFHIQSNKNQPLQMQQIDSRSTMPANANRPATRLARFAIPLFLLSLLVGCGEASGPPEFPPPAVNVALPVQKSVTEWDEYSGRIEAIDTVEIRPRVGGYLAAVHFEEGLPVAKGDLLFSIDDRE